MSSIPFVKMQGAGNDFIVLDARSPLTFDLPAFAIATCDRHFGVGADGVIALEPSTKADFKMSYLNADGSRTICLNGMRCLSRFIWQLGALPVGKRSFQLEVETGVVAVEVHGDGERIKVELGEPIFDGLRIPTISAGEHIQAPLTVGDETITITTVSMGNPHCVIFCDDLDAAPVTTLGPKIEHHRFFPQRTNVEFVKVLDREHAAMRVWERGVGETLACGTGVCGALAAAVKEGRMSRKIQMSCLGGDFNVEWSESTGRISLVGPAEEVFRGSIDVDRLLRKSSSGAVESSAAQRVVHG